MTEKDHYRYGTERKIDPSIPALRKRNRELEAGLRAAHDELTNAGHQEISECGCKIAALLGFENDAAVDDLPPPAR